MTNTHTDPNRPIKLNVAFALADELFAASGLSVDRVSSFYSTDTARFYFFSNERVGLGLQRGPRGHLVLTFNGSVHVASMGEKA